MIDRGSSIDGDMDRTLDTYCVSVNWKGRNFMSSGLVLAILRHKATSLSRAAMKAILASSVSQSQSLTSIASSLSTSYRKNQSRFSQSTIPSTSMAFMAAFVAIKAGVSSRGILLHRPGVLFLTAAAAGAGGGGTVAPGCVADDACVAVEAPPASAAGVSISCEQVCSRRWLEVRDVGRSVAELGYDSVRESVPSRVRRGFWWACMHFLDHVGFARFDSIYGPVDSISYDILSLCSFSAPSHPIRWQLNNVNP